MGIFGFGRRQSVAAGFVDDDQAEKVNEVVEDTVPAADATPRRRFESLPLTDDYEIDFGRLDQMLRDETVEVEVGRGVRAEVAPTEVVAHHAAETTQGAANNVIEDGHVKVDRLDESHDEAMAWAVDEVRSRLTAASPTNAGEIGREQAMEAARDVTRRAPGLAGMSEEELGMAADQVYADLFLLGPLEPLLADESVTEVMANGPDEVWVERRGKLVKTNVHFRDDDHLLSIATRLAAEDNRHVDQRDTTCDCTLHRPGASFDGSRVNITVPPTAVDHPGIDIRKFRNDCITPEALLGFGEYDQRTMEVLEAIVRARMNVIVMGGTGSGKTTLLNALSCFIPGDERIITVEDTVELQLHQEHVFREVTRQANSEGVGEITIHDLVKNALRQRPDRIVVGECRGEEAFEMLQAMSTGHDGSLTTIHANNARHALSRLQMMVQMAGSAGNMAPADIMGIIVDAVDVIVHVQRWPDGARRVSEVVEIVGQQNGIPTVDPLIVYDEARGRWRATGGRLTPGHRARFETNGVEIDEEWWACN